MCSVVEVLISPTTIRPEPSARGIIGAAWLKCCSRLPTHLAHPLENELAVVIHALGTSLQGSRQNRGKPCRLLPANIPGRGSIVVTTRRLCTINTRAPFDHVEVDSRMRRLPRTNSATGTSVNSAPLRRKERLVPKNRFFTSCCVMVEAPRMRPPSKSSSAAIWIWRQSNP